MKLYVLVRKSLSRSQQTVQAAHVVAQYCYHDLEKRWNNSTIVIALTPNINDYIEKADAIFKEPDLGNIVTAVAYYGEDVTEGLKLL